MKRVLTYGTFDLLHWGHIRLLRRAKAMGNYLVVGLSTDEFNEAKPGKQPSYHRFEVRQLMLESIRYVDLVIPEVTWDQKVDDIRRHEIDLVVMGSDWEGSPRFEYLRDYCDVVYLPRTEGTSTSQIRRDLLFEAIEYKKEAERNTAPDAVPGTAKIPVLPTPGRRPKLPPPPRG